MFEKLFKIFKHKEKPERTYYKDKIYGNWKLLENRGQAHFYAECLSCGIKKVVTKDNLYKSKGLGCNNCWHENKKKATNSEYIPRETFMYLPGQTFGKWTVLEKTGDPQRSERLCQCACGTKKIISSSNLKRAASMNGGCRKCAPFHNKFTKTEEVIIPKEPPITNAQFKVGDKHGEFTIIETSGYKSASLRIRCSCGKERYCNATTLKKYKLKMCITCFNKTKKDKKRPDKVEGVKCAYKPREVYKHAPGEVYGKWTVLSVEGGRTALRLCKCSCGTTKLVQISNLLRAKKVNGGCANCNQTSKAFYEKVKIQAREQRKEIIQTIQETKEAKVFEKLPDKLNISIPRTEELNTYIKQAEELLRNTSDIHFENKFKTQQGGLILYWCRDDKTNKFRLMAAETNGVSDIPIKPPTPLDSCDLRIKMRACNNYIKEFLELYEMHISDYLEGKHNVG